MIRLAASSFLEAQVRIPNGFYEAMVSGERIPPSYDVDPGLGRATTKLLHRTFSNTARGPHCKMLLFIRKQRHEDEAPKTATSP